jgi:prepilin-type N-terminal cleavage/methylation domain-containing protein
MKDLIFGRKGFTLIELLLVIVIISILAGVLITLINPAKQQNRANDATTKSGMNKVVLSVGGFLSSYGYLPNDVQMVGSLNTNVSEYGSSCDGSDDTCLFSISSSDLPSTCASSGSMSFWSGQNGVHSAQCYYRYYSGSNLPQNNGSSSDRNYRIYVKSYGLSDKLFVYDNLEGGSIAHCPYDIQDSDNLSGCEIL